MQQLRWMAVEHEAQYWGSAVDRENQKPMPNESKKLGKE
jgi:hypothetical protein